MRPQINEPVSADIFKGMAGELKALFGNSVARRKHLPKVRRDVMRRWDQLLKEMEERKQ